MMAAPLSSASACAAGTSPTPAIPPRVPRDTTLSWARGSGRSFSGNKEKQRCPAKKKILQRAGLLNPHLYQLNRRKCVTACGLARRARGFLGIVCNTYHPPGTPTRREEHGLPVQFTATHPLPAPAERKTRFQTLWISLRRSIAYGLHPFSSPFHDFPLFPTAAARTASHASSS